MTITLPLEPQKEAKLNAVARAKGLTPDELLTEAIDQIIGEAQSPIRKRCCAMCRLTRRSLLRMAEVLRGDLPDLPDRVIAATALLYGVPVLSRHGRIRSSSIKAIW